MISFSCFVLASGFIQAIPGPVCGIRRTRSAQTVQAFIFATRLVWRIPDFKTRQHFLFIINAPLPLSITYLAFSLPIQWQCQSCALTVVNWKVPIPINTWFFIINHRIALEKQIQNSSQSVSTKERPSNSWIRCYNAKVNIRGFTGSEVFLNTTMCRISFFRPSRKSWQRSKESILDIISVVKTFRWANCC